MVYPGTNRAREYKQQKQKAQNPCTSVHIYSYKGGGKAYDQMKEEENRPILVHGWVGLCYDLNFVLFKSIF